MENKDAETTSLGHRAIVEERGAGGKLKKPPSRRPPTTPYTRPQQNQQRRHGDRWLSKLVEPACRLIAGGANLIFPSFFSKSESVDLLPSSSAEEGDHDKSNSEVEHNARGDDGNNALDLASRTTQVAGTSSLADPSKCASDVDRDQQENKLGTSSSSGVSEIEQLIKDKRFSRDEINRLLELIHSRVSDIPDTEQEKLSPNVGAKDAGGPVHADDYSDKAAKEKKESSNRIINGAQEILEKKYSSAIVKNIAESAVSLETSRKPTEEKHDDVNRSSWGTSTPLLRSSMHEDVGTSPVEIARAYMENRTLEVGFGSKSLISKDKGVLHHGDEGSSKSLIPFVSPRSSTCWPGAVVQDQRSYMTPFSQRGKFQLHNFPRTPYSRTIGSKSRSKLQGKSGWQPSPISTPPQKSQNPPYGQINSRGNTLDYVHGSVGPIHRKQHTVSETPKGFSYLRSSVNSPLEESSFDASKDVLSVAKNNLQKEGTSTEISVPTVPSHSTQMARKILEHLERNPPTPKDKAAELKLATSWRKPQFSYATTSTENKHSSSSHFGGLESIGNSDKVRQKSSVHWSEGRENSIFKPPPQITANEASAVVNDNNLASDGKVGATVPTHSNDLVASQIFRKSEESQLMGMRKEHNVFNTVQDASGSELSITQKKPPSQASGTKPVLPSISIGKPDRRLFSYDNNTGFTFPISASTSVSSEPPTPTVMPSSLTSGPQDGNSIPSYSFGLKRSTSEAIIFSFPSTSSAPRTHDESSDLKFSFGSETSTRISFNSVGKDAICY